jgi:hypothetical protein
VYDSDASGTPIYDSFGNYGYTIYPVLEVSMAIGCHGAR